MTTGNDELSALGYASSAPELVQRDEPKSVDEDQLSTMDEVLIMLNHRIKAYDTMDSLSLDPDTLKVFSMEQQIAVNQKVIYHIREVRAKIQSTVDKVREKQNERRY